MHAVRRTLLRTGAAATCERAAACGAQLRWTRGDAAADAPAGDAEERRWEQGMHVINLIKQGEVEDAAEAVSPEADLAATDEFCTTSLILAARGGHLGLVQALLESGSDVNAVNAFGSTALVCAASNNHMEVARVLLAAGADVNQRTRLGSSALFKAAAGGYRGMCMLLIDSGADTTVTTKLGKGFELPPA